ncbi:unnamed protein product, partial [Amoebophrya sp. A120]
TCNFGSGTRGTGCDVDGAPDCGSCDSGYHEEAVPTTGTSICVLNLCTCGTGTPASGPECPTHNTEVCTDCSHADYYTTSNASGSAECKLRMCECDHGLPKTGAGCDEDGTTQNCTACTAAGYHLDQSTPSWSCAPNQCSCPSGTPATGANCTTHGAVICSGCDAGHRPSASNTCIQNECKCTNGDAVDPGDPSCVEHNKQVCKSCETLEGFHLDTDSQLCKPNVCSCSGGVPAVGAECTANDTEICASCNDPGVSVNDTSKACEHNTCVCTNGTASTGGACTANGEHTCASCDHDGLHVDAVTKQCVQNFCTCQNGEAAVGEACTQDGGENCALCDTSSGFAPAGIFGVSPSSGSGTTDVQICWPTCALVEHDCSGRTEGRRDLVPPEKLGNFCVDPSTIAVPPTGPFVLTYVPGRTVCDAVCCETNTTTTTTTTNPNVSPVLGQPGALMTCPDCKTGDYVSSTSSSFLQELHLQPMHSRIFDCYDTCG